MDPVARTSGVDLYLTARQRRAGPWNHRDHDSGAVDIVIVDGLPWLPYGAQARSLAARRATTTWDCRACPDVRPGRRDGPAVVMLSSAR